MGAGLYTALERYLGTDCKLCYWLKWLGFQTPALLLKHKRSHEHCSSHCGAGGTALQAARGGKPVAGAVSHRSGIEVTGMAAALFWDSSAPPAFAWASSVRPLTHTTEQNLWDAPSAAFPLLQLLARVAGEGAVPEEDCSGSAMWPWLWNPEIYFESVSLVSVALLSKFLYSVLWLVHR